MQVVFLAQTITPLPAVVVPETKTSAVDVTPATSETPTNQEIIDQALSTLRLIEQNAGRLADAEKR